jgi:hypothetical protein
VLATFFVSGLLHEYVLAVIEYGGASEYRPHYFYQTAFFMWNGFMLLLEDVMACRNDFQVIASRIPRRVKTVLVLMTVLPISHWFLDEYVSNRMFQDFAVAFPLIVKL